MIDFVKKLNIINLNSTWDVISFVLDMLIVVFLVYKVVKVVKETRAWQLLKGIIVILVITKLTNLMGLRGTAFILNTAVSYLAFALFVIFQPELRRGLEQIGTSKLGDIFDITSKHEDEVFKKNLMIEEVLKAVSNLSKKSTGAIIIFERSTKLGEIIDTGTKIDAFVSSELLENLFVVNTPLHDGAVVIRDNRIIAAACFLVLTDSKGMSKRLGTRHRAAMGITEISDCIAVTVSEETAAISFFVNGKMYHNISIDTLKGYLTKILIEEDTNTIESVKRYSLIDTLNGKIKKHHKDIRKINVISKETINDAVDSTTNSIIREEKETSKN